MPITLIAKTDFRDQQQTFGIKQPDRRRHMYIIGKTGSGKTVLLENMIIQDLKRGHGLAVLDPHGGLAEKVLDFVPKRRINDCIYFNLSDLDYPIAFNVLEKVERPYQSLVASGIISVFKKIWAQNSFWGPRLEYVLRNTLLALLEFPESTLIGVMKMLSEARFRQMIFKKSHRPCCSSFWFYEFSKYPDRFKVEVIAPIQNKVGAFLSSPLMRNIVGQTKSSFSMRDVMDSQKILIANLSKGKIGEDNTSLLGSMLITKLQLTTLSRTDISEDNCKDFYLYVDEFHSFVTSAFADLLAEARKYRLNLILAHQFIEQLDKDTQKAVLGNAGTIIVFRLGAYDAQVIGQEFEPKFNAQDLMSLAQYQICLKLMIDGRASEVFTGITLPSCGDKEKEGHRDTILKVSRERYAKKREVVEKKIKSVFN
jgi:hypothetical protein